LLTCFCEEINLADCLWNGYGDPQNFA